MKIEKLLADYIIGLPYEKIPPSVVEATKAQTLNIISAMIGGSTASGIKELVELLRDWGGRQESSVVATKV